MVRENICMLQKLYTLVLQPRNTLLVSAFINKMFIGYHTWALIFIALLSLIFQISLLLPIISVHIILLRIFIQNILFISALKHFQTSMKSKLKSSILRSQFKNGLRACLPIYHLAYICIQKHQALMYFTKCRQGVHVYKFR